MATCPHKIIIPSLSILTALNEITCFLTKEEETSFIQYNSHAILNIIRIINLNSQVPTQKLQICASVMVSGVQEEQFFSCCV